MAHCWPPTRVPVLVGELTGGIILGRTALHLIDPSAQPLPVFASLGFAMLMLEAGTEVDIASTLLREGAVRAGLAFLVTLAASIPRASLDLKGLAGSASAITLAVAMALAATVVHVVAALIVGKQQRLASGLLASAQLGLPAAAAALGLATGALTPPIATALVAGGVLTLIPATVGSMLLGDRASAESTARR